MIIEKLTALNYKNLAQVDLELSPRLNCFVGDNGEGKTNILDTIYFLAMGKSSSGLSDNALIQYDEHFFLLKGSFEIQSKSEIISCGAKRGEKRQFQRNGKLYDRLMDHVGLIPLVMISPEDNHLISEAAEERRKFINASLSVLDKSYLEQIMRYNNLLAQRNKVLKSEVKDPYLFEVLDTQLARSGNAIFEARDKQIKAFLPYFLDSYKFISDSKENIGLAYVSQLQACSMEDLLLRNFEKDCFLNHTSVGIHRDDIKMTLNGHDIRKCGSQGQQKSFLIALKLAQYEQLRNQKYAKPLLLLDDVFDKLDTGRVARLLQWVSSEDFGQIFITECNRERMNHILEELGIEHHLYEVRQGVVERILTQDES